MLHSTCCPAQPHDTAGSWGSQFLPAPASLPVLPLLYLDNFFTCFIYEDSPPSANTLHFLFGLEALLTFLVFLLFSLPLARPQAQQLSLTTSWQAAAAGCSKLCLATGADGESKPQVGCALSLPQTVLLASAPAQLSLPTDPQAEKTGEN